MPYFVVQKPMTLTILLMKTAEEPLEMAPKSHIGRYMPLDVQGLRDGSK